MKFITNKILGLTLCLSMVLAGFNLIPKAMERTGEADNLKYKTVEEYFEKLVVRGSRLSLPWGGKVLSQNGDTLLVDYRNGNRAKRAYTKLLSKGVTVQPEMAFVTATNDLIITGEPTGETDGSLEIVSKVVGESLPDFYGMKAIALIDSGASPEDTPYRYSVLGDRGDDNFGHGREMVSAIRSQDPDALIVSIKAVGDEGVGSVSSVYAAINMAISMRVKTINLSLVAKSVENNAIISTAIREAIAANIIVVGAAGNSGTDAAEFIPGAVPEVILAGACDEKGERLPSSNYGPLVDWNICAKSTSYASASLAGLINRHCEADETINGYLAARSGEGFIFAGSYEPGDGEKFDTRGWKEMDPEEFTPEELYDITGGEDVTRIRISEEEGLCEVISTEYILPEDGSFVTAGAWTFPSVTNKNLLSIGDWYDASTIRTQDNGGQSGSLNSNASGSSFLVGYGFVYTPGTVEMNEYALKSSYYDWQTYLPHALFFLVRYSNGERSGTVVSDGSYVCNSDPSVGIRQIQVCCRWTTEMDFAVTEKIYVGNHAMPSTPSRVETQTDSSSVFYEEGDIGDSSECYNGSISQPLKGIHVGLKLRQFRVYAKTDPSMKNIEDYLSFGGSYLSHSFNFSGAMARAKEAAETNPFFVGWDYSDFIEGKLYKDNDYVYPSSQTPRVVLENGEYAYAFVIEAKFLEERDIIYIMGDEEGSTKALNDERNPLKFLKDDVTVYPPTREGYVFTGWSGTTLTGDDNLEVVIPGDTPDSVTLTAHFRPVVFTLIFEGPEDATGNIASMEMSFDKELAFPEYAFKKKGYRQVGWTADGENAFIRGEFIPNLSTADNSQVIIRPCFEEIQGILKVNSFR